MRSTVAGCIAFVVANILPATAYAQCAFDGPAKAKGMKTSLVRAFAGCPSDVFIAPNSQTGTGVPSCAPPSPRSPYQFGDKGRCDLKVGIVLEEPCKTGSGQDCSSLTLQAKCSGIVEPNGSTPISSSGWSLFLSLRLTIDDRDNGDMTVIDLPMQIAFPPASNGKLTVSTSIDYVGAINDPTNELPGCSQVELLKVSIDDPDGDSFATLGAGVR